MCSTDANTQTYGQAVSMHVSREVAQAMDATAMPKRAKLAEWLIW